MTPERIQVLEVIGKCYPELEGVELADDEITEMLKNVEILANIRNIPLEYVVNAQAWLETH